VRHEETYASLASACCASNCFRDRLGDRQRCYQPALTVKPA
jgi:hypothetical protein